MPALQFGLRRVACAVQFAAGTAVLPHRSLEKFLKISKLQATSWQVHVEPKSLEGVLPGTKIMTWFVCTVVRVPEVFDESSSAPHEMVEFGLQTTILPFKRKRLGEAKKKSHTQ